MSTLSENVSNFQKCTTNLDMVNFCLTQEPLPKITIKNRQDIEKCDKKATKIREMGNTSFRNKEYFDALEYYSCSLAYAKTAKVATLSYANRSKLFLKRGYYEECLVDIQRALDNDCPEKLKEKLLTRQSKALEKWEKLGKPRRNKETDYVDPESVRIDSSEKYGRYLVADRDIEIGDIIMTEKPFAATLVQNHFIYCYNCVKICYNPIICDYCTQVFYCSDICKQNKYHKYECKILSTIEETFPDNKTELILALKMTIMSKTQKKLLTHFEDRPVKQLYQMALQTSVIYNLLKNQTNFFQNYKNFENEFKDLFLFNLQIIDINAVSINRLEVNLSHYDIVRYGWGMYQKYSLFNHSCHPNCFFYHDGTTLVVRALGTVKKGDQCFISYCYTYGTESKQKRQMELLNKYHFSCECVACRGDWSEEEELHYFDETFAAVQLALLEKNTRVLQNFLPGFIKRLKSIEKLAPLAEIICLRQLVVDCCQIYESPQEM